MLVSFAFARIAPSPGSRLRQDRLRLGAEKNDEASAPKLAKAKAGWLRRNSAVIPRSSLQGGSFNMDS
jgi:hypothetical protein